MFWNCGSFFAELHIVLALQIKSDGEYYKSLSLQWADIYFREISTQLGYGRDVRRLIDWAL